MPSYVLNATKKFQNYGLVLYGSTYDPAFTQGYIQSKPNVSVLGSSCYIDYSGTYLTSDLTYLTKVFKNTPSATGFTFSGANYYDQSANVLLDISGYFTLNQITNNDKLIIGNIVSGFTYATNYKYFDKSNFTSIPQFSTTYTSGATSINYILNNLVNNTSKSFLNSGFIGSVYGEEEYVEFSGTTSNAGKLVVDSAMALKDNREVLYVGVTLSNENLATQNITVTHYLRGNANPEIIAKSQKQIGSYVIFDNQNELFDCFENQNQYQAFLRSQSYDAVGSTLNAYWVPCLSCARLTDNGFDANDADKSFLIDSTVLLSVNQQISATLNGDASDYTLSYLYTLQSNYSQIDSLADTSEITLSVNNGFKLDLSHPTLKGFAVNAYLDPEQKVPLSSNYYLIGTPGFDQASVVYRRSTLSPKKIYFVFNGPAELSLELSLN